MEANKEPIRWGSSPESLGSKRNCYRRSRMSFTDIMGKLENLLTSITKDLGKVNRGNKSAAQRVRVGTLRLEKVGKEFRKQSVRLESFRRAKAIRSARKKTRKKARRGERKKLQNPLRS